MRAARLLIMKTRETAHMQQMVMLYNTTALLACMRACCDDREEEKARDQATQRTKYETGQKLSPKVLRVPHI